MRGEAISPEPTINDRQATWWWVPYLYLLRTQIAVGIVLVSSPVVLLSPVLRGLFDLNSGTPARTASAVALVTFTALATAGTLLVTTWTLISNAPDRFGASRIDGVTFPIGLRARGAFALLAAPVIIAAVAYSHLASDAQYSIMLPGVAIGAAAASAMVVAANVTAARLDCELRGPQSRGVLIGIARWITRWLDRPHVREGYIDSDTGQLKDGHLLAASVCLFSVIVYFVVGLAKWASAGSQTYFSTLAFVLLLLLIVCGWLGGVAFLFDRYRIPAFPLLALAAFLIALIPMPGDDYTFGRER